MHPKDTNIKEKRKPIRSGIHRHLIAKNYQIGETFLIKDCNSFYDADKIEKTEY